MARDDEPADPNAAGDIAAVLNQAAKLVEDLAPDLAYALRPEAFAAAVDMLRERERSAASREAVQSALFGTRG